MTALDLRTRELPWVPEVFLWELGTGVLLLQSRDSEMKVARMILRGTIQRESTERLYSL